MIKLLELPTFEDPRGILTVVEKEVPFDIKRVYYIYQVAGRRGGHRHKKTYQAFICVHGSCEVLSDDGLHQERIRLDSPRKMLLVPPEDWHVMENFSKDGVLLVLASEPYNPEDYIHEPYNRDHD